MSEKLFGGIEQAPAEAQSARPFPETLPAADQSAAQGDWRDYVIRRIKGLSDRTVASLTAPEVEVVRGRWMLRVEQLWASVDDEIKMHYSAIRQRIEHDEKEAATAQQGPDNLVHFEPVPLRERQMPVMPAPSNAVEAPATGPKSETSAQQFDETRENALQIAKPTRRQSEPDPPFRTEEPRLRINEEHLRELVRTRCRTLCEFFYPAGKSVRGEWVVGDLYGAEITKRGSFHIRLDGPKAGCCHDWASGWKGDLVDALEERYSEGFPETARRIGSALGVNVEDVEEDHSQSHSTPSKQTKPQKTPAPMEIQRPAAYPGWGSLVGAVSPELKAELARWRGWSAEYVEALVASGEIVRYKDFWAFPVHYNGTVVAVHCRIEPKTKDQKAGWFYEPKLTHLGISVQPMITGDRETALVWHVTESSWDHHTLCDQLSIHQTAGVAAICTRGAANAKLLNSILLTATEVFLWPQNDNAGQGWLTEVLTVFAKRQVRIRIVNTPGKFGGRPIKDINELILAGAIASELLKILDRAELWVPPTTKSDDDELGESKPRLDLSEAQGDDGQQPDRPQEMIGFLKPSQVKAYEPPLGIVLVGDNHIVRDAVFVIAGAPGVGKSRTGVGLGCSGAMGVSWMGYTVHAPFKTMIIQNENGRYRLKLEFSAIDCSQLEDALLITPPPPFGLCFDRKLFRQQLQAQVERFNPDLVLIDPWNAAARDDRQKDYLETFNDIRTVFPPGTDGPAIGIVAHTRKPQPNERASGRALLTSLAGSHVLGSIPRCVWVLQSASDDVSEERVVLTCCKNNDGELGSRSAWIRRNGLFVPVQNFDWEAFDHPGDKDKGEPPLDETALAEVFENGAKRMARGEAVEALMSLTGRKRSVCYDALSEKGKFKKSLKLEGGKLVYRS